MSKSEERRCEPKCPQCRKMLVGALVSVVVETDDTKRETLYELGDRNWMQCKFCRLILCKHCGTDAEESYCHPCQETGGIMPAPADFTHRVKISVQKKKVNACDVLATSS